MPQKPRVLLQKTASPGPQKTTFIHSFLKLEWAQNHGKGYFLSCLSALSVMCEMLLGNVLQRLIIKAHLTQNKIEDSHILDTV